MRLLFVADGRSPIASNWIEYFLQQGDEVHLASTFPCQPDSRLASYEFIPVALSSAKGSSAGKGVSSSKKRFGGGSFLQLRTVARQWLGPLTLSGASRRLRQSVSRIQPGLIHAMRVPFEGMLAALVDPTAPLLISIWGNDFTLHAPATPLMRRYTRLALQRADAIHTDCYRDSRLSHNWGFSRDKPVVVLPGAGGVQPELFFPLGAETDLRREAVDPLVINPRGFRAYVRNDTFFRAIPFVLKRNPRVRFVCTSMADEPVARRWVQRLGVAENVDLLPRQSRHQMADLFRISMVAVSPTTHDGTPNTLLEAMACGCFPIAGEIESLKEWITPGLNGLLFDPHDPQALAQAILLVFEKPDLVSQARAHNLSLIAERATYPVVMKKAREFYQRLVRAE